MDEVERSQKLVAIVAMAATAGTAIIGGVSMWAQEQYHVNPWLCPVALCTGAAAASFAAMGLSWRHHWRVCKQVGGVRPECQDG